MFDADEWTTAWLISQFLKFYILAPNLSKITSKTTYWPKTFQIGPFPEFQQYLYDFKIFKIFQISPYA